MQLLQATRLVVDRSQYLTENKAANTKTISLGASFGN
jgi:hypothetical protein